MKHAPGWDVIVVGGGHAGCEAAHAASRMGARTVLVTHRFDRMGEMSCNPAIGGIGKGHLVREVDALDGVMARTADRAGIHFRLLNRSKGPAVHGPRVQCDRSIYRNHMQREIVAAGLRVIEAEVVDLDAKGHRVNGVVLADGVRIQARSVVLTAGTFLNAVIRFGEEVHTAGRFGDPAVEGLSGRISDFGLKIGRLKTGTPPRLVKRTIDFDRLDAQDSDADPERLSFLSGPQAGERRCHLAWSNDRTHAIVEKNLARSAVCSGQIAGAGPRYCPSLEDKISRFPEKGAHRIFLEPEGLEADWVYPNGISMSLPRDVQWEVVRSIDGLQRAEIARPGYAVEYDHIDPRGLDGRLAVQGVEGLFLAGQINGTTGYEEAAAQGLAAGVNAAAAALDKQSVLFSRSDSYIGVLIDDLISRGVSEPYRMFTSRAEYRLSLRADNADQRLTPLGLAVGCVGDERRCAFESKMEKIANARDRLSSMRLSAGEAERTGAQMGAGGRAYTGLELLSCPGVSADAVRRLHPELCSLDRDAVRQVRRDALYAPYVERQAREAEALRRDEARRLEPHFDWLSVRGLSNEISEKMCEVRPESVGQASRIEGMTPAALALIAAVSRRRSPERP